MVVRVAAFGSLAFQHTVTSDSVSAPEMTNHEA
jgi:hypothetical protein